MTGVTELATPATRSEPPWRRRSAWLPWALGLVALLACFALQSQLYSGQERTVSTIFMFVALAEAYNLIGGYAGYACFGQVVFFGIAGYATAVLFTRTGLSFWLDLPISALVAAAFAVLIGPPLLRLRGHYFAIATLGVAVGMREVVSNLTSLTGGNAGVTLPVGDRAPTRYLGNDGFYVLFLLIAAVAVAVVGLVSRSKFGFALRAINQDEDAAASAGVNATWVKVAVFALSGLLTGLAGSAYAFQQQSLYPDQLFDSQITVFMITMVIIGGSGTVLGPIVGAVGLQYLSEYLRQHLTEYHTFVLGGIVIAAVILLPQGAVNYIRDAIRNRRFSPLENVRRYRL
jgi:branched-chain amino acid transport system permease protein